MKRHTTTLIFLILALFGYAQVDRSERIKQPQKATVSFRIMEGLYLSDSRFEELLGLFGKYPGVTDEITFFTSYSHSPMPWPAFKDRIALLKERIRTAKEHGYRSGINILSTVGHVEEDLDHSLSGDYTFMTDIDGNVCKGSFCPNDEKYREFIRSMYKEMALADPDYIWIDDDVRVAGHPPISLACFCDKCMSIFEQEFGTRYTREQFRHAVNEGTLEDKLKVRKQWIDHNRNTMANLFKLIETTVHQHRPSMPIGFMTGNRFYEGYDFDKWAEVLAGENGTEVMWRPGGGFYNDDWLAGMTGKSHDVGMQVSVLPPFVTDIQSEIENFTYQQLSKSAYITGLEAASHIGAGATGVAFNVLTHTDEPLDEYEDMVNRLHKMRPFYDLMVKKLGRSELKGISSYWHKNSFADGALKGGSWFHSGVAIAPYSIDNLGIPSSYSAAKADVVKLARENLNGMSREEVIKLLSGAVYMDPETLNDLNQLGYGEFTGFEAADWKTKDVIERFTDHPLNGKFANRRRDPRQAIYGGVAAVLKKTDPGAEVLADLINFQGEQVAKATMGVFENKLGGRICVAGYYPWHTINSPQKVGQLKSVFRWLSKDNLLGYVDSYHKMNLWIREPKNSRMAMTLLNASLDEANHVELLLKTKKRKIKVYDMDCNETVVTAAGSDGPYRRFIIPQVGPWQIRLIETE